MIEVVAGDAAAFAHLVRRHAPMAKRMAVFWGAGADSDDVVQEAFVKAYAALPRFRSDGEFRPWLLCIVRNETRNLFRGRSRRAAREEMARSLLDLPTSDPEDAALSSGRREELLGRHPATGCPAARSGDLPLSDGALGVRDCRRTAHPARHRQVASAQGLYDLADGGGRCRRRLTSIKSSENWAEH